MDDAERLNSAKKHTTRIIITLIILAALITCGALAHSASRNKTNSPGVTSDKNGSSATRQFEAAATISQPFIVTTASKVLGKTITSTVQADGHGTYLYIYEQGGKQMNTVYTPEAFYQCKGIDQSCVKYPNDPAVNNFDPSGYGFSSEKIKELAHTTKYIGEQRCPGQKSSCYVWKEITRYKTSTYYYVSTANSQIVQTIHYGYFGNTKNATKVSVINNYTYKSVHVSVPTDYTDAPKQQ